MKKLIFLLLCALAISACKHTTNQAASYTVIPIDPSAAVRSLNLSLIFEKIEYVQLETPEGHLIGDISRIITHGDRFYILDARISRSVFCFNRDGSFLHEINRQGRGPGEYIELQAITIDHEKSRLLLYSETPRKVIAFDLDGNFLDERPLDFIATDLAFVGEGRVAFFCDYATNNAFLQKSTLPNLILADAGNYTVQETSLRFPASRNVQALTSLMSNFSSHPDGVSLLVPYNDTLYHIAPDRSEAAYLFDFGKMKKSKFFYSMLADEETTLKEMNSYILTNDACNVMQCIESEYHVYLGYQHKDAFHFAFYDKRDSTLHDVGRAYKPGADMGMLVNDIDGSPVPAIYGSDGRSFFSIIQPQELLQQAETMHPESLDLKRVIDTANEEDNPIIAVLVPR
ncbi:MAG: 6-bladed beta-propeller [Odoribacteraceae bacterium]|jgi:hypothetical protein|nr:6-bladed beta-propeller [Odoribacteraceae bacterium]